MNARQFPVARKDVDTAAAAVDERCPARSFETPAPIRLARRCQHVGDGCPDA